MRTKSQLELLQALSRRRKATQAGFTLVEVLVVAGILAVLFASLVPNLLKARGRAQASAVISEAVGQAKACQAVVASGVGLDTFSNPRTGANVICDGSATAATYTFNSRTFTGEIVAGDNINCLNPNVPNGNVGDGVNVTNAAGNAGSVALVVGSANVFSCT